MKSSASKLIKTLVLVLLPLIMVVANNQALAADKITFYHYDLLGSPVATTNELGEVVWREEYSPYGDKLLKQDDGQDNVRGYTGHVFDEETGLTYMQARYYDPQIGRFMGVDPVGFMGNNPISFNRYAYANNNPYKYIDPNGELSLLADVVIGVGVFGTVAIMSTQNATEEEKRRMELALDSLASELKDKVTGMFSEEGDTRKLGDLEPIHEPGHPQNDPEIEKLTDDELIGAINNPKNGDKITVKGNKLYDGNTRINEAKNRGFNPDMEVEVDTLPEVSFDDDDPLGPYGGLE